MKFNLPPKDSNPPHQYQNQIHYSQPSSTFPFFTEQPIPTFETDTLRRRFEIRESVLREIEKERIKAEIIAEVRNELMIERELAMRSAGGFASPFMHRSLPLRQRNVFDTEALNRRLIGNEEKVLMSVDDRYGGAGNLRGIRGFPVSSLQVLGDSLKIEEENSIKEVIVSDMLNKETLSGTKRKLAAQVSEGSSQSGAKSSKKKMKEEWSCAVCQISTTSEHGLTEHLQGKKHQAKEAELVAHKTGVNFGLGVAPKKPIIKPVGLALTTANSSTSDEQKFKIRRELVKQTLEINDTSNAADSNDVKKKTEIVFGTKQKSVVLVSEGSSHQGSDGLKKVKEELSCAICQVRVTSERGLNEHLQGKKHLSKEAALVAHKTGANAGLAVAPINPSSSEGKGSETREELVNKTPETNKASSALEPNREKKKDKMIGENKRSDFKFWCEMCHVGASSETVMNAHKEGKKHSTCLLKLYRKGKHDSEASAASNTCEDKPVSETNQIVVVETVPTEVKPVKDDKECVATSNTCEGKLETETNQMVLVETVPTEVKAVENDDMKCVAAVVAEENITMTAGFGFC